MGYGRRWMVETAYSSFKRTFGEYCMAKNIVDIERELTAKVVPLQHADKPVRPRARKWQRKSE